MLRLRSNEQLVTFFRGGDDDAFRVIHDRYRGPLLTYVRHVMGASHADAEDVLQDVFVRAYRGLRAHDRSLNLSPWLYRVARNACIDELRRRVPVPHDQLPNIDRALEEDPVHVASIQRERISRLLSDLQRLPEQQRSALLLCELIGLSYADVAAALGTSVSAVKSLLVRARLGIAQSLEARETACSEIRDELADAHARGDRPNALARRHMNDCQGCRGYSLAMRDRTRELAALTPAVGPIAVLAKVFGFGGAGSGASAGAAAAGGTSAASGGLAVSAGVVGANAAHVLTVIAATGIVAAGAIGIKEATATHTPSVAAVPTQPRYVAPAPAPVAPGTTVTQLSRPGAATAAAAASHHVAALASGSTGVSGTTPPSGGNASGGPAAGYTPPSVPASSAGSTKTSSSSSSSCAIGQTSCNSGATGASTGYSGTSATNAGATNSKLPLGSGSSTSSGRNHLSTAPIGGGTGTGNNGSPSTSSSSTSSSPPLGSSSTPPLGS